MEKKKDMLEQHLAENFKKLAGEEEQQIENIKNHESEDDIRMPEGTKEAIRAKLDDEIEKIKEAEREEIYSRLSEEDRYALERGRKIIQEEKERAKADGTEEMPAEESTREHTRKKRGRKPWKMYIAVAAIIAMGAVSITAVGGPEQMIMMVRQAVGDREVEKVNSSDENLVIMEEDEEEAYQKISDEFGVEPVRLVDLPTGMQFEKMIFDTSYQVAEMWYRINDESIAYFVNASYKNASWGMDIEDEVTDSYIEDKNKECEIEVKEYYVDEGDEKRFSAQFSFQGLEYFLIGTMGEDNFKNILNSLHFY